jgi:hypothetical protein
MFGRTDRVVTATRRRAFGARTPEHRCRWRLGRRRFARAVWSHRWVVRREAVSGVEHVADNLVVASEVGLGKPVPDCLSQAFYRDVIAQPQAAERPGPGDSPRVVLRTRIHRAFTSRRAAARMARFLT